MRCEYICGAHVVESRVNDVVMVGGGGGGGPGFFPFRTAPTVWVGNRAWYIMLCNFKRNRYHF